MQDLTETGAESVARIAGQHGLSKEAVIVLARALAAGGGAQAQFNHPELGGMGQWSQGGMVMVGDMFNNSLKALVDQVCNQLSGDMANAAFFKPVARGGAPTGIQSQSQSQGGGSGTSFSMSGGFASSAWPAELGTPSSTGSQNNLRYAVFPQTRRLALDIGGKIEVFDIGDHQISGFSQQQGGDQSITFNSQFGLVRVADLPRVALSGDLDDGDSTARTAPAETPAPDLPENKPAPEAAQAEPTPKAVADPKSAPASSSDGDIIRTIEKLGQLRDKGLLTEDEFVAKKQELLSRL
ncbi:MAG: SHOCT domain-containing protein [Pseudomonadota bacterium]